MTSAHRKIDDEAAAWAVRLGKGPLSVEVQAELDRWLAANERHRGAFLRARAVSASIDRLAALAGPAARREPRRWPAKFEPIRMAVAASVVIALAGALLWWQWPQSSRYATAIESIESIRLDDGSHVTLNTHTRLRVVLAQTERRVELERGEALFEVAKDASRPFIVRAGPVSVRAIGTAFLVRAVDNRVDVTVTEGAVELTDAAAPHGPLVRRVAANESATVVQRRQIEVRSITPEFAERQLAWSEPMLEFSGESLATAVQEVNRHNELKIVIDDPALARRPIIGNFRADDPAGFAETVAVAMGAHAVAQGGAIHLRAGL